MEQNLKTKQEVIDYVNKRVFFNEDWEITFITEFSEITWGVHITSTKKTNIIYGAIINSLEKAGFDIVSITFTNNKVIICCTY